MREMTQAQKLAELNQWRAFIHSTAFKAHRRLTAAGVGFELEDVEAMMIESFLKAQKTFDPEYGVGISAYAGRAMLNDFNRFAKKLIDERLVHGVREAGELEARMEDEGDLWETTASDGAVLAGSIAAMVEDPMELVAQRQEIRRLLDRMSPAARLVLRMLVDTPPVLQQAFDTLQDQLRARRAAGERVTVPMTIDADFILDYVCRLQNLSLSATERRRIHKDLALARSVGRTL